MDVILLLIIYIPTISSCFACRSINLGISKYNLSKKTKWPTTPEMPAILGGISGVV